MKINEVLNPTIGLFSHMSQDIWGTALDPSLLDIELFTAIGSMTASPLFTHFVRDGVLDHDGLARLIHQHYGKNWKRLWDALLAEYNIMITTSNDEKRTYTRDRSDTERRDLTGTKRGTTTGTDTGTLSQVRSGSVSHTDNSSTQYGSAQKRTNDTTTTSTDGGRESLVDDYNEATDTTNTLNQTGSGSETVSDGLYGVGGDGMANTERHTTDTTRNFTDSTTARDHHTGGSTHTTTYGKTNSTRDTGSVTDAHTGTDVVTGTSTDSYKDLTDTTKRSLGTSSQVDETTTDGGTVTGTGKETYTETLHQEGSTPLRTYQALVKEEVEIRSGSAWNFTELVINDVRRMIALNIWERSNQYV